jgi:uncharacterized membrane protein YcaP (DUF421 family)
MPLTFWDQFQALLGLGLDVGEVGPLQVALRTLLIYAFALALVRIGSKRFLAEATAFDVIVGIMLGSVMSRAINGSAPFLPTLAAGAVLVGVHWLLGLLSSRIHWFGPLIKGNPILLIQDGKIQEAGMRKAGLSRNDLKQALRLQAQHDDPSKVKLAYMERNGSISVLPQKSEPRILEVAVKDGVQTVRIELS